MNLEDVVRIGIVFDVNIETKKARVHFPDSQITSGWLCVLQTQPWMPKINDRVVCLYIPVFNGDGFVIGGIA